MKMMLENSTLKFQDVVAGVSNTEKKTIETCEKCEVSYFMYNF